MIKKYYSAFTGKQIDEAVNAIVNNQVVLEDLSPELIATINEWIANADTALSQEFKELLSHKENTVNYITVEKAQGVILPDDLLLLQNRVSRLVYQSYIYNLTFKNKDTNRYTSTIKTEKGLIHHFIDVNMISGEYALTEITDSALREHIQDKTVHITQAERENWDNKVSCEANQIDDSSYSLHLFK